MKKAKRTLFFEKHLDKLLTKWAKCENLYKWEIVEELSGQRANFKYFFELGYQKAKRDLSKNNA